MGGKVANIRNQVHSQKRGVDKNKQRKRLWLKDGDTTMLITKELSENGCKALIHSINTALLRLGVKPLKPKRFLITQ